VDEAEKMHRNHPGSKVVIFDSSGHSPFVDEHERFFGLIKEFVTKMPKKETHRNGRAI
jgi:proline iminopeptidase